MKISHFDSKPRRRDLQTVLLRLIFRHAQNAYELKRLLTFRCSEYDAVNLMESCKDYYYLTTINTGESSEKQSNK